jgi:hypothetical protein
LLLSFLFEVVFAQAQLLVRGKLRSGASLEVQDSATKRSLVHGFPIELAVPPQFLAGILTFGF